MGTEFRRWALGVGRLGTWLVTGVLVWVLGLALTYESLPIPTLRPAYICYCVLLMQQRIRHTRCRIVFQTHP